MVILSAITRDIHHKSINEKKSRLTNTTVTTLAVRYVATNNKRVVVPSQVRHHFYFVPQGPQINPAQKIRVSQSYSRRHRFTSQRKKHPCTCYLCQGLPLCSCHPQVALLFSHSQGRLLAFSTEIHTHTRLQVEALACTSVK